MKKVLFISYDGLTDPLGQSQIIPYIIGLHKHGHTYSVLSCEKKEAFAKSNKLVGGLLKASGIQWHPLNYTKQPPILSTLKDVKSMAKKIREVVHNEKIEVLHCRSYISMFAAFPIAKKLRIKLIFDMRGFWIDERVEGNLWNLKNPVYGFLYRYFKKKERLWMNESDLIVSLTETGKKVILEQFSARKEPSIHVIPCCADERHFNPETIDSEAVKQLRAKLDLSENDQVLGYSGSIGTWYLAEEMMLQFKRMQKAGIVNKFLWITREEPEIIFSLAMKHGVSEEHIRVYSADRNTMPICLSLFHLGIFYIKPSFSKKASSPTKLGELLLMGIPVICNNNVGDLDGFFKHNQVGICHDINDLNNISLEKISKLKSFQKENIRQIGLQYFSLKKGISLYGDVLNNLR